MAFERSCIGNIKTKMPKKCLQFSIAHFNTSRSQRRCENRIFVCTEASDRTSVQLTNWKVAPLHTASIIKILLCES